MIDRRTVVKAAFVVAGAASLNATVRGVRAIAQPAPPRRRSLQGMDLDDEVLTTLRDFVRIMSEPSRQGQPVSWVEFSNVHGSNSVGFNFCPHGNWYFLPWHRSYIAMYERAVRAVTGKTDFAMPYWDWTDQPEFPAAFGDATFDGQPNPLFVANRAMTTGDRMDPSVTGQAVMEAVYESQTFEEFASTRPSFQNSTDSFWIQRRGTQSELESNPHNNVHCIVGGPFMCSASSPRDPIFQMHHCNIDRIWAEWISRGRANSDNPFWLNMAFENNFIDPQGNRYTDIVRDLLDVEALGYSYGIGEDAEPPPRDFGREFLLSAFSGATTGLSLPASARSLSPIGQVAKPDQPLNIVLKPKGPSIPTVIAPAARSALARAGVGQKQVYAFIRMLDPERGGATQLRVFVNLPEANASTKATDNPHYVTSIGFFGPSSHHGNHDGRPSVAVNLTPALRRLGSAVNSDTISVQLVPVAQRKGATPGGVKIAEVEVAIV